jgi:2-polyprenyl-3-methyl-5-hydroxy-6-metoxy-1,4-benzoquinol methylase
MSSDPRLQPQATGGRAPDIFRQGGWVPMREYRESEAVDFVIVGTGAGGGTLAALLAEQGFSVIAFDAGEYFRPMEDFASDETSQNQLYWTDKRVLDGPKF